MISLEALEETRVTGPDSPKKLAFYDRLKKAWNEGQEQALIDFGDDCRTYDLVLYGVRSLYTKVARYGENIDLLEMMDRWGKIINCLPTTADPIIVFYALQNEFPQDFERRGWTGANPVLRASKRKEEYGG